MQIAFTASPGTSLTSKSLPNASWIRGIQIDNPSGNWLYVVSEQLFCPPYTIGWAIPLSYDQSSITVEARLTGPASQIGSNQGEDWSLTLFDEAQSPNAGTPYQFVEHFTPTLTATSGTIFAGLNGVNFPATLLTLPAIVTKRYRVKTILITKSGDATALFNINSGATTLFYIEIMNPKLFAYFSYPDGLDFDINTSFSVIAATGWVGYYTNAIITYQVL